MEEEKKDLTEQGGQVGEGTVSPESEVGKIPETIVAAAKVEPTELPLQATTERITTEDEPYLAKNQHPNDVKFKVKYGKDFKGEKTFADGSIQIVSKESAEHFTKIGIGSVIK